jgi:hypothetical protein
MNARKVKFKEIARKYNYIFSLVYNTAAGKKELAFAPIKPVPTDLKCECGLSEYNATNFFNLIHFCPEREIEVFESNFLCVTM